MWRSTVATSRHWRWKNVSTAASSCQSGWRTVPPRFRNPKKHRDVWVFQTQSTKTIKLAIVSVKYQLILDFVVVFFGSKLWANTDPVGFLKPSAAVLGVLQEEELKALCAEEKANRSFGPLPRRPSFGKWRFFFQRFGRWVPKTDDLS